MTVRKLDPRRGDDRSRVWEHLFETFTTTNGATAEQTATLKTTNGNATRILMAVSSSTGNEGATLTLDDVDGFEIFNSGEKAHTGSYIMDVDIPIKGEVTLGMTPGGDPGASGQTVVVKIMGE